MKKILFGLIGALCLTANANAIPVVSVYNPANVGIGTMTFVVSGTTITIDENWTSAGPGYLEISGLDSGVDYILVKNITNNSGVAWTSFANELMDPDNGPGSNDDLDPKPYPSYVPATFTTSNDDDGLSFAQGSNITRSFLPPFSSLIVDELKDARDFLDFYNGTLLAGSTATATYGLRDNQNNQPFLLSQRPNAFSNAPEPGTLVLTILGLLSAGLMRRRSA